MYIYGYWSETPLDDDSKLNVFRYLEIGDEDAMSDSYNNWLVEHSVSTIEPVPHDTDLPLPYFWYEGEDDWRLYSIQDSGEFFYYKEV